MRQLIIARKDLGMSLGKLAAQCCHASLAFLTSQLKDNSMRGHYPLSISDISGYAFTVILDKGTYEDWVCKSFTKTICEARNRNHLLKAKQIAEDNGLQENVDFWMIKDNCLTELEPEEYDDDGIGRTLTCVGFRPLTDEIAHAISKKFQLYK